MTRFIESLTAAQGNYSFQFVYELFGVSVLTLVFAFIPPLLIFVFSGGKFISEFLVWDPVEPQVAAIPEQGSNNAPLPF